jgi:hypothetical protein
MDNTVILKVMNINCTESVSVLYRHTVDSAVQTYSGHYKSKKNSDLELDSRRKNRLWILKKTRAEVARGRHHRVWKEKILCATSKVDILSFHFCRIPVF